MGHAVANPFMRRDFDKLKEAERILHDLLPQFDKAEACGVECQQLREYAKGFQDVLSSIEREFMTPPPQR